MLWCNGFIQLACSPYSAQLVFNRKSAATSVSRMLARRIESFLPQHYDSGLRLNHAQPECINDSSLLHL